MQNQDQIKSLSNQELLVKLTQLSRTESDTTLEVLLHLMELEKRRLHLELGFSSLFAYCRGRLHYSEGAANRRIKAARCIRAHPRVYELLKERRVSLSTVCIFSGVLTCENEDQLLAEVVELGQAEVEKLVSARYREPNQRAKDVVRVVPQRNATPAASPSADQPKPVCPSALVEAQAASLLPLFALSKIEEARQSNSAPHSLIQGQPPKTSCSEVIQRYSFSAGSDFERALGKLRVLLSSKYPKGAGLEDVFLEAMSFYLKAHEPRVKTPSKAIESTENTAGERNPAKSHSRHIPLAVKAAVYKKDEGCCSYVGADGRRCGSIWGLEFDHIVPFAKGGESSVENVRLLCKSHNMLQAEKSFGREHIASKIEISRRQGSAAAALNSDIGPLS